MERYLKGDLEVIPIGHSRDDQSGGSLEVGGKISWGDGDGAHWEGYFKGEAHDDKGNYAEGQITQKDDGRGEAEVKGGRKSNDG